MHTKRDAAGMKHTALDEQTLRPGHGHSTSHPTSSRHWPVVDDRPAQLEGLEVTESSFDDWAAVLAELDRSGIKR